MRISDPGTVALITASGLFASAAIAGVVNWLIKRQGKGGDDATARKTEAETVAVEVRTARELLADVKTYFSERLTEQAADHARETAELNRRIDDLSQRVDTVETASRALRVAWDVHRAWDIRAYEALRATHPDYPPPPVMDL
jgi:hypothetical protein